MKEDILEKSIVIIGPAGVGKSFVSKVLSKNTGFVYVSTDLYRHLPHLGELYDKLEYCKDQNEENDIINQIKLRKRFPNLPNYRDMGFDPTISKHIESKYGKIAWHFYNKPFETELLKQILSSLEDPCILDVGAGTAVSIDDEYKKIFDSLSDKEKEQYKEMFKMQENIGFDKVQKLLQGFKNVVCLTLPEDYKEIKRRSSKDVLNDYYIKSGQFEQLATVTVDTTGLVCENRDYNPELPYSDNNIPDKGNREVAERIAHQIITVTKTKKITR